MTSNVRLLAVVLFRKYVKSPLPLHTGGILRVFQVHECSPSVLCVLWGRGFLNFLFLLARHNTKLI